MRSGWAALVAALGFFAIVAQTLLFREWLDALEGSELAIGSFFGAWLLWVGVGALVARLAVRRVGTAGLALLALLYLPALVLQSWLIENARHLAGVESWELLALDTLVLLSLLANAPLSLLTGFLFTAACRTASSQADGLPVARVYVLESLGACLGGAAVTALLALGLGSVTVAAWAGLVLAVAAAACATPRARPVAAVPAILLAVLLLAGLDRRLEAARDADRWERLLPRDALEHAFATSQARYLVGAGAGVVHVVSHGTTVEAAPDPERAGEVAALHLAQVPEAKRIVVVGPGALSIVQGLGGLPAVERLVWLHPDPDLPGALRERFPALLAGVDAPAEDARAFLAGSAGTWDLVILHLPDVTTLAENRFATREFLEIARSALRPAGVVSLRIAGGENVLGEELARVGASALVTLESVFARVVLKPGEESWWLASDDAALEEAPAVLRDRWASVEGAAGLYPPEAVPGLYLPDRAVMQREAYAAAIEQSGRALLLNTDREPKALLYGLAARARRTTGAAVDLHVLLTTGAVVLGAWILLYAVLRILTLRGRRAVGPIRPRPFDAAALVLTTGLVGMAVATVLMVAWQARFGSLFVDVGLLSSLFMLGLAAGGFASGRWLAGRDVEGAATLPALLVVDILVLVAAFVVPPWAPKPLLAALFVPAGAAAGALFALAAWQLRAAGQGAARAGALLEAADHAGGALGAALAGLLLLPLFGAGTSLLLLGFVVLVNLAPRLAPPQPSVELGTRTDRGLRIAGYLAVAVTVCALTTHLAAHAASGGRRVERFESLARELAGSSPLALAHEEGVPYFPVEDGGWIFASGDLAPDVYGYGGPLDLVVRVDAEGRLMGYLTLAGRETPAYAALLGDWRQGLAGRDLFAPDPFADIDTVSGATITADAVLRALERSGRAFAHEVLGREVGEDAGGTAPGPGLDVFVLLALAVLAILLRTRPDPRLRRAWLVVVLLVTGFWLNAQYSTQQVFALLGGELPGLRLSVAAFFVVGVPLLVLFFGNVYCGWLCPFGAAQELVGDVGRRRWDTDPHREIWRFGRAVKYALLAVVLVAVALTGRREILGADPLVTLFSGSAAGTPLTLAVLALLLSLVFGRFFCRNLCPAGAFLALLNRVTLLRRWLPKPRTGRCDLGVRHHHDLDCICCDRCHHATSPH